MGRFRFTLESVLRYRERLEEEAMQAFAAAQTARAECAARLERLENDRERHQQKLYRVAEMDENERWLIGGYLDALRHDIEQTRLHLIRLENELDRCRTHLVAKSQDRKLLDTLKEKQALRHAHEESVKEQRMYDETATLRFSPPSF